MFSYDVSWLNFVTVTILTLALFAICFASSFYLLAVDITKNRGFVAAILATFASTAMVSLFALSKLNSITQLADIVLILSAYVSLAFWAGSAGVITWVVGHFELVNKHVDASMEGLSDTAHSAASTSNS